MVDRNRELKLHANPSECEAFSELLQPEELFLLSIKRSHLFGKPTRLVHHFRMALTAGDGCTPADSSSRSGDGSS